MCWLFSFSLRGSNPCFLRFFADVSLGSSTIFPTLSQMVKSLDLMVFMVLRRRVCQLCITIGPSDWQIGVHQSFFQTKHAQRYSIFWSLRNYPCLHSGLSYTLVESVTKTPATCATCDSAARTSTRFPHISKNWSRTAYIRSSQLIAAKLSAAPGDLHCLPILDELQDSGGTFYTAGQPTSF